jgi:hypothetical protein
MERRNKPLLCIAIAVLAAIGLSGCPASNVQSTTTKAQTSQAPTEKKKVILTTFTVLADMAQNVAGDRAIVESLTKQGAEIHGYEPTPGDLKKAQQAALILDNGMGSNGGRNASTAAWKPSPTPQLARVSPQFRSPRELTRINPIPMLGCRRKMPRSMSRTSVRRW